MADTLTITDNRTGKQYDIPIENSTIRALDLRQIKVDPDEFGLMTYDPAFQTRRRVRAASRSLTATRASFVIVDIRSNSSPNTAPLWKRRTCC